MPIARVLHIESTSQRHPNQTEARDFPPARSSPRRPTRRTRTRSSATRRGASRRSPSRAGSTRKTREATWTTAKCEAAFPDNRRNGTRCGSAKHREANPGLFSSASLAKVPRRNGRRIVLRSWGRTFYMTPHTCKNVGCQSVDEVEYDLDGVVGELDGEGRNLGGVLRVENVVFVQRHEHENALAQNVRLEENLHVVRSLLSSSGEKTHTFTQFIKNKSTCFCRTSLSLGSRPKMRMGRY